MTIKPVISQKPSEKKENHGHGQESQQNNGRGGHRNILVSKSSSEGQSPQRRNDVYDDGSRLRRSPHKSVSSIRSKRDHHKRDQREKHCTSPQYQVHSPHASSTCVTNKSSKPCHGPLVPSNQPQPTASNDLLGMLEDREVFSGYNSGDEHLVPKEALLTPDEWKHRDEQFIKAMSDRGLIIQDIVEDGACLFRAISLQIFGDQEMHEVIRQQTMDYIYQNREYFAHFVTEDITSYVKRKRNKDSHGNHIEIQAMSEIYNRPVELYCYQTTPTNIFNSEQINNGYDPLRLSYQRGSHYNAIIDPYNASVGVGLGLAGYKPESQTREAILLSEQLEIEQTMFEDKLKTTDWEATNEVIEEQIARESYLQWCRENMQHGKPSATTATNSSSTSSSTNSTVLSSTITSSSIKTHGDSCASVSPKDTSQYLGGDIGTSLSNDHAKMSIPERLRKENGMTTTSECYDSDDTDLSSSSSAADLYKDNIQLAHFKKIKYGKRASLGCSTGKRRHKRRRRDGNDINCSCDTSMLECCCHPRIKQVKPNSSSNENQLLKENRIDINQQMQRSDVLSGGYGVLPGTSKQATETESAVSSFYQSLLESSYADDGVRQLSESEMIVRAIRLSRIDFFENVKRHRDYVLNTNCPSTCLTTKPSSKHFLGHDSSKHIYNENNSSKNSSDLKRNESSKLENTTSTAVTTQHNVTIHDDDSDAPSP